MNVFLYLYFMTKPEIREIKYQENFIGSRYFMDSLYNNKNIFISQIQSIESFFQI
jgi:hypothetical protein